MVFSFSSSFFIVTEVASKGFRFVCPSVLYNMWATTDTGIYSDGFLICSKYKYSIYKRPEAAQWPKGSFICKFDVSNPGGGT